MCAVFGFLNYGKKVNHKVLVRLINELAKSAEIRGTDATGISYVNDGKMVTFKKAKPAHKVKLYFPKDTKAVIGHTRMTTQGSESRNYNNHPFEGKCNKETFALAHNGMLYNDKELRKTRNISETKIETDSYIAVQLLEQEKNLNAENVRRMSELVKGSFVFTILRNDNTLFFVKGSNPLTIYHFSEFGLYVYASTKSILDEALKKSDFNYKSCEIRVSEGEIFEISPDGKISRSNFESSENYYPFFNHYSWDIPEYLAENDEHEEMLMEYCSMFGVDKSDIQLLLDFGYCADEIEEMLMDTSMLDEILKEIKEVIE